MKYKNTSIRLTTAAALMLSPENAVPEKEEAEEQEEGEGVALSLDDLNTMTLILEQVRRGNNVEVKRKSNGEICVYKQSLSRIG